MPDLVFSGVPEAPPVDLGSQLVAWQVTGPFPAPAEGERYPAHLFSGSEGWACINSLVNGFTGLTVRAVLAPNWAALNGAGFRVVAAYGDGGPLASQYHSWAVGLVVVGTVATVRVSYQDSVGGAHSADLASFDVPPGPWIDLAVTRETSGNARSWRAYLAGEPLAPATVTTEAIAFVQAAPLTLAHLSTLGVASAFFVGRAESLAVLGRASTPEEIRQEHLARRTRDAYRAVVARAMPDYLDTERGTAYHSYRVRPLADQLGKVRARIANWEQAALLPAAYGEQLERWERTLGILPSPSATLEERQRAAGVTFSDPATFTVERTRELGARITGSDIADVQVIEPRNITFPRTTATPGRPVQGPWFVSGDASATYTAAGLRLRSRAGVDGRWWADGSRGIECTLCCEHREQASVPFERVLQGGAFSATLVALSGTTTDNWAGFILSGRGRARFIGVYDDGGLVVAQRDVTERTLGPWTQLATFALGSQLALFYDLDQSAWFVGVSSTPTDPAAQVLYPVVNSSAMSSVRRIGLTLGSEGEFASDVEAVWTDAVLEWPRAETTRKYYVYTPTPAESDPVTQTALLRAVGRPTTQGHVTYTPTLVADVAGSFADFSPLTGDSPETPIPLPDGRMGAHRAIDWPITNLWVFQRPGAPLDDRVGGKRLWEPDGVPVTVDYAVAGPDAGRNAISLVGGVESYLVTRDPAWRDTANHPSVGALHIYRIDGGDGALAIKAGGGKIVQLRQNLGQVQLLLNDGGGDNVIGVAGATSVWLVVGWYTDDVGNCGIATTTATQSGAFALGTLSNSASWRLGNGNKSADATHRLVAWHDIDNLADLQTAVQNLSRAL